MNIGAAVEALKNGQRVARAGWNGKGMWLRLVMAHDGEQGHIPAYPVRSHVVMKDALDWEVPWLCSQTDLLAEDWELVTEPGALVMREEGKASGMSESVGAVLRQLGDQRVQVEIERSP